MKRRILSMLLAMLMVLTLVPSSAFAAGESATNGKVDVAFVIDSTGSMGEEIANVKDNLNKFTAVLNKAGLDFRIAVVEYKDITEKGEAESTKILADADGQIWFSTSEQVEAILSGITADGGGDTDETAVDALAAMMTLSFRDDASKFAILLTDAGYKNTNNYGFEGMTDLIAGLIEKGISTSVITSSGYQSTYYNLYTDTDGIYCNINGNFSEELVKIANFVENVVKPVKIKLTCEEISRNKKEIYYLLTADITSTDKKLAANNIKVTLTLPEGVTSDSASEVTVAKLEPEQTETVRWNFSIPILPADKNYTFIVKAKSEDFAVGVVCGAQDTINVAGNAAIDYTWVFGEDNYCFLNTNSAFGTDLYISDADLSAYLLDLSNTEILQTASWFAQKPSDTGVKLTEKQKAAELVKNLKNNKLEAWDGSCYGLTLTAALFKTGICSPLDFGGNTTYKIPKMKGNTDSKLESFINIYHISQASDIAMQSYRCVKNDSYWIKSVLKNMWNTGLDIGSEGKSQQPYLVNLAKLSDNNDFIYGHAVVCYGAENGDFKYWTGLLSYEKYNRRLLIADPNKTKATYIYIADDFGSAVYSGNESYNGFGYRDATLSELNSHDYKDVKKNYNAKINADRRTNIQIAIGITGKIIIVGGSIVSCENIEFSTVSKSDGENSSDSEISYLLKDTADSYTITPYEGSSINTSVYFDDYAVDIDVDAESIDVLKDGKVKLTGATGDAKLGFAINGSNFDFVDISGKCDGDVVIDLNGDSIVISGDISDYSVSNMDRDTNETDAVIHGDRDAKIDKEDNKLKVSTDEDADGVYETELDSNELKHAYGEFKDNGDGTHSALCSICGHAYTEDHVYVAGICTICGASKPTPRPVHVHRYTETVTEPTCTEKGYTTYTCICGSSYVTNYVDALGHTEVVDPAVAATCEKTGLTEGKHCSVCNEVLVAQKETPKTGHKFENGKCSVCGAADPNYVAPVVNPFKDVKEGDAFYDEILWAADKGIIKGDGTGNYNPNDGITRAQIVMILWNAAGNKEASKPSGFADVKDGAWYAKAVAWAVENGITNGTDLGFEPDRVCTRAEIVTFLHRANNKPAPAAAASFTDLTQDWYKDAVAWAVENGITKGVGGNRFAPNDTCTRGQAAAFMYRLAQLAK